MTQGTYGPQVLTVGENYVIRTEGTAAQGTYAEGTYGPLASHLW